MKNLAVLLVIALAGSAWTQTTAKPSAAKAATPTSRTTSTPATHGATTTPAVDSDNVSLPVGTPVHMKLETTITTTNSAPGDKFSGRVTEPVMQGARTVIPVGAAVEGKVVQVSEPRRIRGTPTIELRPELVVMPNGERWAISAVPVDTSMHPFVEVDDEGRIKGQGHDSSDWKETGIGAGAGALIGGLAAGGRGLLYGAGVGATASVVHWLVKRRTAELPAGTEIIMELSRPMVMGSMNVGQ